MTDPVDDEDSDRPTMSADGQRQGQWKPASVQPLDTVPEEQLELVPQDPRVVEERIEVFREEPPERPSYAWVFKLGLLVLVLGALGGLGVFVYATRTTQYGVHEPTLVDQVLGLGGPAPLIINSTPEGATIIIDGQVEGQTPWASDNRWHGDTSLVIKHAGYQPWEGRFQGAKAQTLNIHLKK